MYLWNTVMVCFAFKGQNACL